MNVEYVKRRTVLGGVGLALSPSLVGCLGDAAADKPNDGDGSEPTDAFARTVSIAAVDSVPEAAPVAFEIEMLEKRISETGTAVLEITSANTGDAPRTIVPYYKGRSADAGDPGIVLYALTAPDGPPEDDAPECIADPKPTRDSINFTEEGYVPEVQPGETLTEEYVVADDPSVDGCVPPGEYRFEREHLFDRADGETVEFTWGFTLRVRSGENGSEGA